jgi:hypothetical protein
VGDVIQVYIAETNTTSNLRIISITETIDADNGHRIRIQCGNPPNMLDRLIKNDIMRVGGGSCENDVLHIIIRSLDSTLHNTVR